MSPLQWKLTLSAAAAFLAWLFTTRPTTPNSPGRTTSTLDIDANVNSAYFGMTDEEIAAAKAAGTPPASVNPAVDPGMRHLIDVSNVLIVEDNANP